MTLLCVELKQGNGLADLGKAKFLSETADRNIRRQLVFNKVEPLSQVSWMTNIQL